MVGPVSKVGLYLGENISHFILDMLIWKCLSDNLTEMLSGQLIILSRVKGEV